MNLTELAATACTLSAQSAQLTQQAMAEVLETLACAGAPVTLQSTPTPHCYAATWNTNLCDVTLLIRPSSTPYCPYLDTRKMGLPSHLSEYEAALLWMISQQLISAMLKLGTLPLPSPYNGNDISMLQHLARGGATYNYTLRKEPTVKQRLVKLRRAEGVKTTPALLARLADKPWTQ